MNRNKLKTYAPLARREFIQAVTDRAALIGLSAKKTEPMTEQGDVVLIAGKPFEKSVADKRRRLEARIKKDGFEQTMEAVAYTWFNRFVAIRYMELHGYLEHGYRVLSSRQNAVGSGQTSETANRPLPSASSTPEVLHHAEHVEFPGLKRDAVIDLKLAGNKEGELYRLLLIAQCNALSKAMPFLFEKIDDETELLLPDNLLHTDSLIRKLVRETDEEDWQQVEIIGWLYQFYISEKKDQVIGKVVASEDIPAATQLFTPNWIVRYLVQNTLGRQWLEHHPASPLREKMEYYIEPAEQTPEVQAQLQEIIRQRTLANRGLSADSVLPTADFSLNPEAITFLDPACGSGHILVEAYDLFKAIYQEKGYRSKDIPSLILQKNLFGLEIDDRAAQLAAFALMMKARADDKRIFEAGVQLNIVVFQESKGLNAEEIAYALEPADRSVREDSVSLHNAISELLTLFEHSHVFGSLIHIPDELTLALPGIEKRLDAVSRSGDLTYETAMLLEPLLRQAELLSRKYNMIVANPPYVSNKGMNPDVKAFVRSDYKEGSDDLYSAFILRCLKMGCLQSSIGMVTPFTWMYLSSFKHLRRKLLSESSIGSLVELETNAFEPAMVTVCVFTLDLPHTPLLEGSFIRLSDFKGAHNQSPKTLHAISNRKCGWFYSTNSHRFSAVPGCPIAYWASNEMLAAFQNGTPLMDLADVQPGLQTSDNNRFVRLWHEVAIDRIGFGCKSNAEALETGRKWFPYNKGGDYRLWYGNNFFVVNWADDGQEIKMFVNEKYPYLQGNIDYVVKDRGRYFNECITWSKISSAFFGVRKSECGFLFDVAGSSAFPDDDWRDLLLAFLCSKTAATLINVLNPTLNKQTGNVGDLPILIPEANECRRSVEPIVAEAIEITKRDWNSREISWGFQTNSLVKSGHTTMYQAAAASLTDANVAHDRLKYLEIMNNEIWASAYGVSKDINSDVADEMVSVWRPSREDQVHHILSYSVGCIMGRYSLDKAGLIYAHSGNDGFDPSQYTTFRADDDGLVPLLEDDWGIADDATSRFVEFIGVAWAKEHLEENLAFVAQSLGPKKDESPQKTIRRYFATGFFKHHLRMYKNRPIYWLFSSGKQRAFQCLVYLHRYNAGTLARMRTEYVIPLQGQIAARIEQLEGDKASATSTSRRTKLQKEQDKLKKQQAELATFEEKLKHYADQRITLDLDDGVKVNYAKFGDLLAETKAVTGGKEED